MESNTAVKRLSTLAQDSRLAVFRLLVKAGPAGIPAGEIARALEITPNTLSAQLTVLANAGLVTSRRDGRSINYAAR
jgi:ArsR family transcriptional regulator, arsenate/arsenite/antimonite-responsive transcriptional repressor